MPSFSSQKGPNTVFTREDPPDKPIETIAPITQDRHQGVAIDTSLIEYGSLLQYIEGRSWQVTYYQQVLDTDTELQPQNLDLSPIHQQYTKINRMEFKVTDDLSYSQDTETRQSQLTGGAVLYPPVTPNVGDMFIADIGDGRAGVFQVTQADRASYRKQSCYQIEYTMVDYASHERLDDFKAKTNQETYFVKSFLEFGENPVIIKSEYEQQRSATEIYNELIYEYLAAFYSRTYKTLLVPDQPTPTYDAFLVKALLAMFDSRDHSAVQHISEFNVGGQESMHGLTIWDALLRMTDDILPLLQTRMGLIDVSYFGSSYYYNGIYFSGVDKVVFPKTQSRNIDRLYQVKERVPVLSGDLIAGQHYNVVIPLGETPPEYRVDPEEVGVALPDIHPVTEDDYYVLSQGFYSGGRRALSQLEVQVMTALRGETPDMGVLLGLAQRSDQWASVERFYFIPVILMLLKSRLREVN